MKKLDSWLTVVMGVSVGLFLARLLYLLWDVNAHPALYAAQSAPWYVRLISFPAPAWSCAWCLGAWESTLSKRS